MKNRYMAGIFSLLILWLFCMSYSSGPGQLVGLAVTTSPGESGDFCAQAGCHSTGNFDQTTSIEVANSSGELVDKYNPGEVYDVSVVITAGMGTPNGYGFQMVALKDSDTTSTDSWQNDLPASIHRVRLLDRDYVEHDGPMTGSNRFTLDWTAPEEGSGNVTFYAAGNAVNLNGSPSGDDADTTRLTLPEAMISSLSDLKDQIMVSVYPNPASDFIQIESSERLNGSLHMYNMYGQILFSQLISGDYASVQTSNLPKGLYILEFVDSNKEYKISERILLQ